MRLALTLFLLCAVTCQGQLTRSPTSTRIVNLPEQYDPSGTDYILLDRDGLGTRKAKLAAIATNIVVLSSSATTRSNVAAMTATVAATEGTLIQTLAYATEGDNGGFQYVFREGSTSTNLPNHAGIGGAWELLAWDGDVRAFGAIGDGVTLCNNAISNAWRVGRDLYFPQGRYLIDNSATTDNEGRPCAIFVEPDLSLDSRLNGLQLRGDGMGKSIILMTNAGTGLRLGGTNYGGSTTASFMMFNTKIENISFEGDKTSVQTAFHMRYCGFNSQLNNILLYRINTVQDTWAAIIDNCWNLTSKGFYIFGDSVTDNGLVITNANQMSFDYVFLQGFATKTTNGTGILVMNPDGFRLVNFQAGNKSAYGVRIQATTAAGNDGPTDIWGESEGPMVFVKVERSSTNGVETTSEYLDNLNIQVSGYTTGSGGGGNQVTTGLALMTNNFRHCIWLQNARNVKLRSSHYNTRVEDFTGVGGGINTNYCVYIEDTCRDVIIEPSIFDASSLNYNIWDKQLRPSQQPNSWILHQAHTPTTTYYATSGISGGSSIFTTNAYSYFREGNNVERFLQPKAIELGVEAYVRTVGPITNGLIQMWAANNYIRTNNPTMRRWLGWTATTNMIQGLIFRGQIMAPIDDEGNWQFQVLNPLGWETEWTLRPIGGIR